MKRFSKLAMTSALNLAVLMSACVGCVPEETAEIPAASTDPNDAVVDVAIERFDSSESSAGGFEEPADASAPLSQERDAAIEPAPTVSEPLVTTSPGEDAASNVELPPSVDVPPIEVPPTVDVPTIEAPPPLPDLADEFREFLSGNRAYWVTMVGDPAQGSNWIGYRNTLKLCESGFFELKVEAVRPGMVTSWTRAGIWSVLSGNGIPTLMMLPLRSTLDGDLDMEIHALERLGESVIIAGEPDMSLSPLPVADTDLCDRLASELSLLIPD